MRKSRTFRPTSLDTLEQRLVMNAHIPVAHGPVTVGALGDSYTDEYQFYSGGRNHARNWVEQLAAAHKANFGGFTRASRGEPRNQGFAQDWARSDSTSTQMVANQLPGLTAQVAAGQVKYVSIFTGANDFRVYLEALAANPNVSPSVIQSQLTQIAQTVGANIETAVITLLSANPKVDVVVATIPSLSSLPLAQSLAAAIPQGPAVLAGVDQTIAAIDAGIRSAVAASPRVAVSDLAAQSSVLATAGPSTSFGGATFTLTTSSNDYHSLFLADGVHTGTAGQGLIADSFINTIDTAFGARVAPFTPRQIVREAAIIAWETRRLR